MPPLMPPHPPASTTFFVSPGLQPEKILEQVLAGDFEHRLISLVAPPGGGKTTFLQQLETISFASSDCFSLPLLTVSVSPGLEECLQHWMDSIGPSATNQGFKGLDTPPNRGQWRERWLGIVSQLPTVCKSITRILLVDGLDEMDTGQRQLLEADLLVPFLFRTEVGERAIIARRDEFALIVAQLRWEEDVRFLRGLEQRQQAEQVRLRLEAIRGRSASEARARLEWPEATNPANSLAAQTEQTAIANAVAFAIALDEAGVVALVERLAPFLTPNPYVNLLLLRRTLRHPQTPLDADDCRRCLEHYMRRSRLPEAMTTDDLIAFRHRTEDPRSFRLSDVNNPAGNERIKRLIDAGIVAQIPGTARYGFEPAVIQLIDQIQPALGWAQLPA